MVPRTISLLTILKTISIFRINRIYNYYEIYKCFRLSTDSAHKSADEVVLGIIAQNDELLRTVDQYDRNKAKEINTRE